MDIRWAVCISSSRSPAHEVRSNMKMTDTNVPVQFWMSLWKSFWKKKHWPNQHIGNMNTCNHKNYCVQIQPMKVKSYESQEKIPMCQFEFAKYTGSNIHLNWLTTVRHTNVIMMNKTTQTHFKQMSWWLHCHHILVNRIKVAEKSYQCVICQQLTRKPRTTGHGAHRQELHDAHPQPWKERLL